MELDHVGVAGVDSVKHPLWICTGEGVDALRSVTGKDRAIPTNGFQKVVLDSREVLGLVDENAGKSLGVERGR